MKLAGGILHTFFFPWGRPFEPSTKVELVVSVRRARRYNQPCLGVAPQAPLLSAPFLLKRREVRGECKTWTRLYLATAQREPLEPSFLADLVSPLPG